MCSWKTYRWSGINKITFEGSQASCSHACSDGSVPESLDVLSNASTEEGDVQSLHVSWGQQYQQNIGFCHFREMWDYKPRGLRSYLGSNVTQQVLSSSILAQCVFIFFVISFPSRAIKQNPPPDVKENCTGDKIRMVKFIFTKLTWPRLFSSVL